MIVLSEDEKKLVDAGSIFISPVHDKEAPDVITGYRVLGKAETSPKPITLKSFETEEEAKAWVKNMALAFGA